MRAFLLIVLLLGAQDILVSQKLVRPVQATPDAIVFGDREWVYYLAPNSTAPRRLAKGHFPALSPDRRQVAYCKPINNADEENARRTVMIADLSTGTNKEIYSALGWMAHLRWSPNGAMISLTLAYPDGKRVLNVITPTGAERVEIVALDVGADDVFNPIWSPDSQSLYFHDMNNLFQVNLSGRVMARTPLGSIVEEKAAITSSDSFLPCPTDPAVLAYTRSVPGSRLFEHTFGEPNTALFLYDTRTKSRKRLTSIDLLSLDPIWSRDGRFIYFSGYYDREGRARYPFKIYRITRDGSGLTQITAGETPDT